MKKDNIFTNSKYFLLYITIGLFVVMFGAGSIAFPGFFSLTNFYNLLIDNAYLLILGVGMTFVIVSGGIDLSVGSVLALTTMLSAHLIEKEHMSPLVVIPLVILMGALFGSFMGYLIQTFDIAPFIVTLGGLYLARGLCYVISVDTISFTHPFYIWAAEFQLNLIGNNFISLNVIIAFIVIIIGIFIAHYTKFGRTVYAIGGNEQSAVLMGLPVGRTKILIYTLSGVCSAIAGVVFTFYMRSGYALHGKGMELDTIAAVVIGGTLLTGGAGYIFGTIFGVFIYGTIQYLIMFQGTLSAWWTRIAIGFLIFVFCLLQRFFDSRKTAGEEKQKRKLCDDSTPKKAVT